MSLIRFLIIISIFFTFSFSKSTPFTCSNDAYIFSSEAYNTETRVDSFDLTTGEQLINKNNINRYNINALGYNVIDNYLWGFDRGRYEVVKLDINYDKEFYKIDGLPTFEPADDKYPTYHAGDVSLDGILYLFTVSKKDTLYLVDVNHLSINYLKTLPSIHLSREVGMSDFAFSPIDNMLYTVDWYENLIKIDQNSGKVTKLGHLDNMPVSGNVASVFFDRDGNLYAHHSNKADVYKIDISKVKAEYYSNIGTTFHGDGARCANAVMSKQLKNIGEFRFDNCENEWKMDYSSLENNITGGSKVTIIKNDGKNYMENSASSYDNTDAKIPHIPQYEISEGTISMLLYDHHNISTYRYNLIKKDNLIIKTLPVGDDNKKGTIDIELNGYKIHTDEVFWTTEDTDNDLDTQWIHITFTFGSNGMKLYINGELKGTNSYRGGLKTNKSDLTLPNISGYYDEIYIFEGQANDTEVKNIYNNTINNKNIDGTNRDALICDDKLEISINNITKLEGDSGYTDFNFTVSLNRPAPEGGISFDYGTKDGTAGDEDLSDSNDTILPKVSISDATATEGDSGNSIIKFDVLLDKSAPIGGVTVQVQPHNNTALEGSDYSRISSSIYIPAGEISGKVEFNIIGDTTIEETESFKVELFNPQNATLNRAEGVGTIEDNDSSSSSSFLDLIKDFFTGHSSHHDKKGSNSIEKYSSKNSSFQKESEETSSSSDSSLSSDSSNNILSDNIDYKKIIGKLSINEGETNATISVSVIGDDNIEDDETFYVVLLPSEMDSVIPIGTGTIINDDENISQKLLANYYFDECLWDGTDKEVRDSSGDEFHGRVVFRNEEAKFPITTFKEKIINRSAKFTKADNSFVKVTNIKDFNSSKFSISMWVKVHENVDGWQTLIDKRASSDKSLFNIKYINKNGDDKIEISTTFNDGSTESFDKNSIGLDDNSWHYLVVTYYNREYKVYLDKLEVTSKRYFKDLAKPNSELYIGGDYDYISNMYIDEVKIFNTLLKSKQIEDIYNNESSGKNWDGTDREESLCADSMKPFVCNSTLYISNRTKIGIGSGDSGKTWLHTIDQNSTPYTLNYIGNGYSSSSGGYNALGYNTIDNFMYALFKTHLLKIDRDAKVIDLGAVQGLTTQLYAGAFDRDGNYFVSSNGSADDKMYQIDIKEKKVVKTLNLRYSMRGKNEPVKFWDMTIDKSGDYFYAMLLDNSNEDINDKFVKIDKNSGIMSVIKDKPKGLNSAIDTIFSDVDGDLFLMEHNNGFYKIDGDTGNLYKIATTDELSVYHDGANCMESNISEPSTISIEKKVIDFEGDSGEKIFKFKISFSKPAPEDAGFWVKYSDGVDATSPIGTAFYKGDHSTDYDFSGEGRFIEIPKGTTSYELNATIYGDIEIEPDEKFYIEIYNGKNLAIKDGRGVGIIVNDDNALFNIERVGSDTIKPTTIEQQREKESLYTQISDRDFNYCIVSYDKNESNFKEYPIEDITLKIELIDNTSTTNKVIYTSYKYLDHKSSRFNIIDSHDLELNATKDAIYKISYLEDNQTIVKGDYSSGKAFENNSSVKSVYSRDSFSIRPAGFKLMLWADDGTIRDHLATSNQKESYGIALASGYKYELQVKSLGYRGLIDKNYEPKTYYKNREANILSPIQEVNATLLFDGNKSICNDIEDKELKYYDFIDGINSNKEFSRDNVGNFIIKVKDENWTNIDHSNVTSQLGCNINSSSNELDSSGKFGCNIDTTFSINSDDPIYNHYYDLKVYFQPYSFDVNLDVKSKTNSGHNDFLYMGDLTKSDRMAILIDGNITAKEKGGKITTNFTKDCLAHEVKLSLDYTIKTDRGVFNNPTPDTVVIKTTKKTASNAEGDIVKIQKKEQLNSNIKDDESDDDNDDDDNEGENSLQIFETNALDNNITIKEEDFKNSKKGSVDIALLYNIKKSFNKTINPVKIDFHKAKVSSIEAGSNLADNEINDFIPTGEQILNKSKTLYYATVMPDKENYPDSFSSSISTPVGAYIYCDFNRTLCNDMIGNNGLNSFKTQNGWYTSVYHNSIVDGTVNPKQSDILSAHNNRLDSVSITPNSIPNFNQGIKGRLEDLRTNYIGSVLSLTTPVEVEVNLNPSPWLSYHPTPSRGGNPFYRIKYRGDDNGTISGVGKTGSIIGAKANRKPTNRMDW